MSQPFDLEALLERLHAKADGAYMEYINLKRCNECLGQEIKFEHGTFGEAELKAHCAAAEKLGYHRALKELAHLLGKESLNEPRI